VGTLPTVFAVASLIAAVTAAGSWSRRRRNPAARALAVIMAGIAGWSGIDATLMGGASVALRRPLLAVQFVFVSLAVLGLLALPRLLADPTWRPGRRSWWLLAEPLAIVPVAAIPATAHLVYDQRLIAAQPMRLASGPAFEAHTAYCYVLLASALVLLVRRWRSTSGTFRRQAAVLLLSAVPPVLGNVVAIVLQSRGGSVPITPLGFLATGLVAGYAVFRMGLLRLVPVARGLVVETMTDAVLVSDPAGRLLDLNPAARRMLAAVRPQLPEEPIGCTLAEVAGAEVLEALQLAGEPALGRVVEAAPGVHLDVRSTRVTDPKGRPLGIISVIRDVSVLENLKAELAEEAVRDHLTGLYNRRHLDRLLAGALAEAGDGQPVGVVLLDADHFKRVNDGYGHAAGDQVLRGLAGVLRASTRPGDTIARLGGEEFVIVLPGADLEQARLRAEAVRAACGRWQHEVTGGTLRVTVSAGVAAAPADGADPATLLAACDRALYAAKAAGRDRVETTASALPATAR
jgi:diguanylate cyclase (GGDEF)-like protein